MFQRRGRLRAMAGAVALAAVLAGCTGDGGSDGSATVDRLREAGEIRIGIKHDQPLFGQLDASGVPQGFDIEMGRIIAAELGIDESGISWVETPSRERERAIVEGEVDLVIATYTITDERRQQVGFAGPYYVAGQSLLTRRDDPDIAVIDDLVGKSVCTVEGSTAAATIERLAPEAALVLFPAYSDCVQPLRVGQVDAVTTDNVILAGYAAESNGQLRLVGAAFTLEPYGIGLAKDDADFRAWVNDVLEQAMDDGRWRAAWDATAGEALPPPQRPYVDRYED